MLRGRGQAAAVAGGVARRAGLGARGLAALPAASRAWSSCTMRPARWWSGLIERVLAAAARRRRGHPRPPLADTIKRVSDGVCPRTVDRSGLGGGADAARLPRGGAAAGLRPGRGRRGGGHRRGGGGRALGRPVEAVPGSPRNRKITDPPRPRLGGWTAGPAQAATAWAPASTPIGWCRAGRWCSAACASEPEQGLQGHSDGDCVIHARLRRHAGRLAAGDMGQHFPSADGRWKDAPSRAFLQRSMDDVAEEATPSATWT